MNEDDPYKKFTDELADFAARHSITRIKLSTPNFDREFKLGQAGNLMLVSTKAVIRALGHTAKVPIGEGEEFSTYEEAEAAIKKKWSEYYRNIRAKRSDQEKVASATRQRKYRARKKAKDTEMKRQQ